MNAARTIYWPDPSWSAMQARAQALGVSVSAFIRRAVEVYDGEAVAQREQGTEVGALAEGISGGDASILRRESFDAGVSVDQKRARHRSTSKADSRPSAQVRESAPGEQGAAKGVGSADRSDLPSPTVTPRQPRVQGPIAKPTGKKRSKG